MHRLPFALLMLLTVWFGGTVQAGGQDSEPVISRVEIIKALAAADALGDVKGSCRSQIGRAHAGTLVALCNWVSSATHPPCNMANACGLITEHIRYMCRGQVSGGVPCSEDGLPPASNRP